MACGALFAGAPTEFTEHFIAGGLPGGSQVVVADLIQDGKPDIIAVASGVKELVWFENPGWKRHTIASDLPCLRNVAVLDVDGDGIPELVVAHEFSERAENSLGILSV